MTTTTSFPDGRPFSLSCSSEVSEARNGVDINIVFVFDGVFVPFECKFDTLISLLPAGLEVRDIGSSVAFPIVTALLATVQGIHSVAESATCYKHGLYSKPGILAKELTKITSDVMVTFDIEQPYLYVASVGRT